MKGLQMELSKLLDYTESELMEMSDGDLTALMSEASSQESLFNTRQLVEKLSINSLYGALANRYFPLFNQEIARSITGNGRYYIKKMSNYIGETLQGLKPRPEPYGVYNDTDSHYFTIEPFMEGLDHLSINEKTDFADKFYKDNIDPTVQDSINDFAEELNVFDASVIGAEREIIADRAVFVAKKKYFARVIDSEGVRYTKPKLKVMGLELIKSSTPLFSKKYLKESLNIILDSSQDEMTQWVNDDVKTKYISNPLGNIASVSGVSNIDYTLGDKGIPIGARSVLVHNKYITENNLESQYQLIQAGTKTKRLYLVEPNPLQSNIVAFTDDRFIEQFKDYIDFDVNFEKGFLKPLELMTTALQWDLRRTTAGLDDW